MPRKLRPAGQIASPNGSLTFALLDADATTAWEHTDPRTSGKNEFTGHPRKIMEAIQHGQQAASLRIGKLTAVALELEGMTGVCDVYRLADDRLAFVEPPRDWFEDPDNHGGRPEDIAALFEELLADELPVDAEPVGTIDVPSGKLAAVYMWHRDVSAAKTAADQLADGAVARVKDRNGDSGIVATLPPGKYLVHVASVAGDDLEAVAAYVSPA
ncbi:MAG: hypothetical protein JWP97_2307 [Labilithrix sp.]|nr:hypothetical protein [Labilithrix sp.]